ncbi:pyridoxal phosphate-dependent aminotransferase [Streptococcaceae bacterium ESL0729]|nr:pyridoxal phosphate-dependent aminotransferase [Streptococcaceae bacterium ESL0729]
MKVYNFTDIPNRLNDDSIKWAEVKNDPELLPMWIADMDFEVLDDIRKAAQNFALSDVYGYSYPPEGLYQAIIDWAEREHNYKISKDSITFLDGVLAGLSIAIESFTKKGDAVLINSPVYPPFAKTVRLKGRKLVANSLTEKKGQFEIDFVQLEEDLATKEVKLYILCSPHNPGGRVWSKDELSRIGKLCQKYGVILVVDEIHQDLVLYENVHHSINTVDRSFSDFTILLTAATKTFNIAGTKNSYAVIENPKLRAKFKEVQEANHQTGISTLGYLATEAAYTHGKAWLEELKKVLEENITYLIDYLSKHASKLKVMKPQGTYLLWLDFSAYKLDDKELNRLLKEEAKLILNPGLTFGKEGKLHARMNVATSLENIKLACTRLAHMLEGLE